MADIKHSAALPALSGGDGKGDTMRDGAWKCSGCQRTFKGGGVHRTAATDTEPVYRYCDNCWAKRPAS
jgi:ribosomal protein L37AE/L43A